MKVNFHLVESRLWPIIIRMTIFFIIINFLGIIYGWSLICLLTSIATILLIIFVWVQDITREALLQGHHTCSVEEGLKKGFMLFIVREVIFFFSFFWSFFQFSLSPLIELGSSWPPIHILFLDPLSVTLLNTIILLSRGILVTLCHHSMLTIKLNLSTLTLRFGLALGIIFTILQGNEYVITRFTLIDRTLGTCFFVITGFHGLHVLIGRIFLTVILSRLYSNHFSNSHHSGFEIRAWYWHFVDVVWIFLFIFIYLWGSTIF